MRHALIGLTLLVLLAACGEPAGTRAEPDDTPSPATGGRTDEQPADEPSEEEAEEQAGRREAFEVQPPATWSEADLTLEVSGVRFVDRDWVLADSPDAEALLEDNTEALVAADVVASNGTDQTISWYPAQGTLVVGSQQQEASLWLSDDVGGDFFGGVTKEGVVVWEFTKGVDELIEAGSARYVISAPHDAESWDDVASDIDLTVQW